MDWARCLFCASDNASSCAAPDGKRLLSAVQWASSHSSTNDPNGPQILDDLEAQLAALGRKLIMDRSLRTVSPQRHLNPRMQFCAVPTRCNP